MKRFLSILVLAIRVCLASADEQKSVSYYHEVLPIFKRSCNGCHHPGKLKGELDMTTHAALKKGGKHGAVIREGEPKSSSLVEEISGEEPSMPKEGDPLSKEEVALIERWIAEGAKDDTPADKLNPYKLAGPPAYARPAVISALAYSPDGEVLAVSGYHEVLLHRSDGSGLIGRLLGESPRIDSIAFSSDGNLLATAGGAPAVFGEVQLWNVAEQKQIASYRISNDSLYGVSFSPDNTRIAFGGADKSLRMIDAASGEQLLKFDNHSDWIFGTAFTVDGKRLLSGSRDRAMKLIDASNAQFIDDINKLLEEVLCIARHPKEDKVAYGGEQGTPRIYKISDNQGRTAANNDVNLVKAFERQPGPVHAVAFNSDGSLLAVGGKGGEARIYKMDGARAATCGGHEGAIFALAFHPSKKQLMTGGYDGKLRIFDSDSGHLIASLIPFPLTDAGKVAAK